MPPKPKFSKQQITDAALQIVASEGIAALTARSLGDKLGSSARPVFTVFESMEEVRNEVTASARRIYDALVADGLKEDLAFKGVGKAYIRFAAEHPKLFQLLFMCEKEEICDIRNVIGAIDGNKDRILQSIEQAYRLPAEIAMRLYTHMWIYTHGIAVLIATDVCRFSASEISDMLTQVFSSLLQKQREDALC